MWVLGQGVGFGAYGLGFVVYNSGSRVWGLRAKIVRSMKYPLEENVHIHWMTGLI